MSSIRGTIQNPRRLRYDCLLCGQVNQVTPQALRAHVRKEHSLEIEEYYWRYVLKLDAPPVCEYGCGKPVTFIYMNCGFNRFFNRGHGSGHYIRLNGQTRAQLQASRRTLDRFNNSDHGKDVLRKRAWEARQGPEFTEGLRRKAARMNYNNAEFMKSHNGMRPIEWILWEALSDIRKTVHVVPQDRRYWHGKNGGFILDFYIPDLRINIELDGTFGHEDVEKDKRRDAFLLSEGITVLRFTNKDVVDNCDTVIEAILDCISRVKTANSLRVG